MRRITRRGALLGTGALGLASKMPNAVAAPSQTLRIVLQSDLTSLDPVFSTATFVRNHGYFVYDQLFAFDSKGVARPQMVEEYTVSPDHKSYRFKLRDGLAFHDSAPVRAADCVASIRRWGQRDVVGKVLATAMTSLEAVNDKTFTLTLGRPFAFVIEALARITGSALFIMPERLASTPANVAIKDPTGSGPFTLSLADFKVGDRVSYRRNDAYRPRPEPADGLAGGKVVKVDQVDWLAILDPATQSAALQHGEIDFLEQPTPDVMPTLLANSNVRTFSINPVGYQIWLRFNSIQPPFNDPRARQAMLHIIDQKAVLDSMGIRPSEQIPYCPAFFFCGTPFESESGAVGLREPDYARAQALMKEAGYDGRKVVLLNATDLALNNAAALTIADGMQKAGFNMDVVATDWSSITARRNRRDAPETGGWNIFISVATQLEGQNPLTDLFLASPGDSGLTGWPNDPALEALRRSWWEEEDPAVRQEILDKVQARATEVLPYIPVAQFRTLAAYRSNIEGLRPITVPVFWDVEKH